jgi:hypothetical protein
VLRADSMPVHLQTKTASSSNCRCISFGALRDITHCTGYFKLDPYSSDEPVFIILSTLLAISRREENRKPIISSESSGYRSQSIVPHAVTTSSVRHQVDYNIAKEVGTLLLKLLIIVT